MVPLFMYKEPSLPGCIPCKLHAEDTPMFDLLYILLLFDSIVHLFVKSAILIIGMLYLLSFVETPRKFIIAELSIRKLGSSSVLIPQN